MRTPLNAILILSELLSKNTLGNFTPEDVEKQNVITSSAQELLRLVNDILDLEKIESGYKTLKIREFHTGSLLQTMREMFEHEAKAKNLNFNVEDTFDGLMVTDEDMVSQIVRNFLSNPFKYTKQGHVRLLITQRDDQKGIKISVSDTGIAISREKQKYIFNKFQQAEDTNTKITEGTGLGLAICRNLTNLLKGEIQCTSSPKRGSEFTTIIPSFIGSISNTQTKQHSSSSTKNQAPKDFLKDYEEDENIEKNKTTLLLKI